MQEHSNSDWMVREEKPEKPSVTSGQSFSTVSHCKQFLSVPYMATGIVEEHLWLSGTEV